MLLSVFAFIVTLSICVQEYDANPSSINSDKSRVTSLNPEDMEVLANSPAGLRSGWKSHDRQQRRLMVGQTDDLTRPKGNSLFTIEEEIMDVNKKLPQPEAEPHLPVKK
ncbi:RxLR-like protein [Plasmopara halstedii]|uniref:RxLR-like protein n=1 Tax=Plasmopara halstedii TaxID=4781 RepID=A0A0P1AET1_PLAHL|nr:RxLR-like protein [Plasmopara halstedii]CEG38897.1 RxLR-like protein [Plasmopara halstedii]|eukprot:XP_024575266.1 RxLR-like protein [Plasmopara halstedii]